MLKMEYILFPMSKDNTMISTIYDTLLILQGSLANCVIPTLRAIALDIDRKKRKILILFYYDKENVYELEDFVSTLLVEVDTYAEQYSQHYEILQLDLPKKIPSHDKFAFLRYEPILPEIKRENRLFLLQENFPHLSIFRLDMQEALLGKVSPALRYVSVGIDTNKRKLIAHFIYDGEISELNYKLAAAAIQDSRISFPDYEMDSLIERVDYPNDFQHQGNSLAYWRQEWIYKNNERIPAIHK